MEEINLYNGAVAKMPQQQFAAVPSLPHVQGFGHEVDEAIKKGLAVAEDYAELHDFGVRQEVAAKRNELDIERETEWARRSALANGAEGAFWTAEGDMNEEALQEFANKWQEKYEQLEMTYLLPRNAQRDNELTQRSMLDISRQTQLMAVQEEARRRRAAFDTNLKLATEKGQYQKGNELLADAVKSGMLTPAEAELQRLRMSEQRMRGLGSAARGGSRQPVTIGGREWSGPSAALAMQAAKDGWKGSADDGTKAVETQGLAPVEVPMTLSRTGEVNVNEPNPALGYEPSFGSQGEGSGEHVDMPAGPEELSTEVGTPTALTLSAAYNPFSMDDVTKVPQHVLWGLQDDFSDTLRIKQDLGVDGRMHFDADQNAPQTVQNAAAQAEVQGAIDPNAAKSVVGEITLDAIRQNPDATVEQILTQFDKAGIYEALGDGDAEVGKVRTRAIVQDWHARGKTGYNNMSAKNIEAIVDARVADAGFGKGQEWKAMEALNPHKAKDGEWEEIEKPEDGKWEDPKEEREYKRWWSLYKVYQKYRNEYAAARGLVVEEHEDYEDEREEFAERAQGFYNWYMSKKHGAQKEAAVKAGKAYYIAAISEELANSVTVGEDGKPVNNFSNEVQLAKGVLARRVPNLGVEEAAKAAEEKARAAELRTEAQRARALESYKKLAGYKQESAERSKAAAAKKNAEEKAAERRRAEQLYQKRRTPKTSAWEWDNDNSADGMPPACTVPKAEYARLVDELGLEEEHVAYMYANGKKIMVLGYNNGPKIRMNAQAIQAVYGKPKKGEKWRLNGELGYYYDFKKGK